MTVSAVLTPVMQYIGNPPETGAPHGYFGGGVESLGDASGGDSQIDVDLPRLTLQGKLFMFRKMVVSTDADTVRLVDLLLLNSYFSAVSSIEVNSGVTVEGHNRTSLVLIGDGAPFLWRPENNLNDTSMFRVAAPNTNGERLALFVEGDFWDESRLRKDHVGPLIRW